VAQNGRVGIAWSGGSSKPSTQGTGPQIVNNHVSEREQGKWSHVAALALRATVRLAQVEVASGTTCWSVDGVHFTSGSDTNENRGYNMQGFGNNV